MEKLIDKLKEKNLIGNDGNIILEEYSNGLKQVVDVATFASFFSETDFTYEQLIRADQGKGYIPYFNKWREMGVVK